MAAGASHISIIAPPLADEPAGEAADDLVTTPDFWPDLDIPTFRDVARADSTITDIRARAALQSALETVLIDCTDWAMIKVDLGFATLADVPSGIIDGESRLVRCFRRAVFAYAKAELVELYLDFDATGKGNRDEEWSDGTIIQLRRDGKHAIRDLLGKPRLYVSSI